MRYLLFGSTEVYYAEGGVHNLLGVDEVLTNLFEKIEAEYEDQYYKGGTSLDWWHVYDMKIGKIIMGSIDQPHPCDNLNSSTLHNVDKDCCFFNQTDEGKWNVVKHKD